MGDRENIDGCPSLSTWDLKVGFEGVRARKAIFAVVCERQDDKNSWRELGRTEPLMVIKKGVMHFTERFRVKYEKLRVELYESTAHTKLLSEMVFLSAAQFSFTDSHHSTDCVQREKLENVLLTGRDLGSVTAFLTPNSRPFHLKPICIDVHSDMIFRSRSRRRPESQSSSRIYYSLSIIRLDKSLETIFRSKLGHVAPQRNGIRSSVGVPVRPHSTPTWKKKNTLNPPDPFD